MPKACWWCIPVPAKNVPELIALAKAQPGKLSYASGGMGTTSHLAGELFKTMAGVDIVHVPYKGNAPAITDVLGGQVQMIFATMPTVLPQAKAGGCARSRCSARARSPRPTCPTIGRDGARLRGDQLDRPVRARGHAAGDRRRA